MLANYKPIIGALEALDGSDNTVKLLAAESILTIVLNDVAWNGDDLASDMLDQSLEIIAYLIERAR
jgi:hypothetical protein